VYNSERKVFKLAIALLIIIKKESVTEMLINPVMRTTTRFLSRVPPPTRESMPVAVIKDINSIGSSQHILLNALCRHHDSGKWPTFSLLLLSSTNTATIRALDPRNRHQCHLVIL
jgi:hypothetical protein